MMNMQGSGTADILSQSNNMIDYIKNLTASAKMSVGMPVEELSPSSLFNLSVNMPMSLGQDIATGEVPPNYLTSLVNNTFVANHYDLMTREASENEMYSGNYPLPTAVLTTPESTPPAQTETNTAQSAIFTLLVTSVIKNILEKMQAD